MVAADVLPVVDLSGVIPTMVTPFRPDGSIDEGDLDRELDFLAGTGVRMIGVGYGSEVHRLDPQEAADLVAYVAPRTRGRLGVVGSAEAPSTRAGVAPHAPLEPWLRAEIDQLLGLLDLDDLLAAATRA